MQDNINIFEVAKPQSGEFFKFKDVGDQVQGTYIDARDGVDSFGNDQTIYVLLDASNGKVWNLGFRKTAVIIHERMRTIKFGTIVGFKFEENRPSKKNPGTLVKIIRIYADPKFVDHEWLAQQKSLETRYGATSVTAKTDEADIVVEPIPEGDDDFVVPEDATPTSGSMPKAEISAENEAIEAIRNLAKTKGLTTGEMSNKEADKKIEEYTGLPLTKENLTKIIISLTQYKV